MTLLIQACRPIVCRAGSTTVEIGCSDELRFCFVPEWQGACSMFNPFNYQGATATIDGQPARMHGHSRIPEFVTNGVATSPVGVGYGQTYGYAAGIPSFNGTSVVNPMTGIPVTATGAATMSGIPATIPSYINNPFVNPFVNTIGG